MDTLKIQSVKEFPTPTTKKCVRAFLGLSGYYRKFIPNYVDVAAPLSDITRKTAPTRVSSCERAFVELKNRLCSEPILGSPDFNKRFVLQTDGMLQKKVLEPF